MFKKRYIFSEFLEKKLSYHTNSDFVQFGLISVKKFQKVAGRGSLVTLT